MATNSIKLLTGNSHPELANLVAARYALPQNICLAVR
jgi:ribose-phosphate pyrophosphokinase